MNAGGLLSDDKNKRQKIIAHQQVNEDERDHGRNDAGKHDGSAGKRCIIKQVQSGTRKL